MAVRTDCKVTIKTSDLTQTKTIANVSATATNQQLEALATSLGSLVEDKTSVAAAKVVTTDLFAS